MTNFESPHEISSGRAVYVYLQPRLLLLEGSWEWPASADAAFCSDVMISFPKDFEGVRGILHPEDAAAVRAAVGAADASTLNISFRIISTYGAVLNLVGTNIRVGEADSSVLLPDVAADAQA
ncbi:MAG: hypothetical protein EOP50_10330, partial [Sphingobacteriales bacterium]